MQLDAAWNLVPSPPTRLQFSACSLLSSSCPRRQSVANAFTHFGDVADKVVVVVAAASGLQVG